MQNCIHSVGLGLHIPCILTSHTPVRYVFALLSMVGVILFPGRTSEDGHYYIGSGRRRVGAG